eukprot:TRINITY_DN4849_c0_g1_i1.p1 TRINITY_DN4849_c0_g1~~TRINITY_DN4849_c0_g1_i1.p1  ORF type:complete len:924 (+),score=168.96 TRINITY_DN4849_c0_g1_i1:407-2773(+)
MPLPDEDDDDLTRVESLISLGPEEAEALAAAASGLAPPERRLSRYSRIRGSWHGTEYASLGARLATLQLLATDHRNWCSQTGRDEQLLPLLESMLADHALVEPDALWLAAAAPRYDAPAATPGNGLRSLLTVLDTCVCKLILSLHEAAAERQGRWARASAGRLQYLRDYGMEVLPTVRRILQCAAAAERQSHGRLFLPTVAECAAAGDSAREAEGFEVFIDSVRELPCECFYGARLGFVYHGRLRAVLRVITAAMAGYGDAFHGAPGQPPAPPPPGQVQPRDAAGDIAADGLGKILASARALGSGMLYMLDPAARAAQLGRRMRQCDIAFAKGFWGLTETAPLAQHAGAVMGPRMHDCEELRVPITIQAILENFSPGPVQELCRSAIAAGGWPDAGAAAECAAAAAQPLSQVDRRQLDLVVRWARATSGRGTAARAAAAAGCAAAAVAVAAHCPGGSASWFQGLTKGMRFPSLSNGSLDLELYPLGAVPCHFFRAAHQRECAECVVLHFHGGGFVAQSPRSHETYLRMWAKQLRCPVLSVDYSLSPEAHFPRAVDECHHVLQWLRGNAGRFGLPPTSRVVLAGDSAGGNLAVSVALRAVSRGEPPPHAVLSAYGVFNVQLAYSPSRALALQDALLPLGILEQCLGAYVGPRGLAAHEGARNPLLSPLLAPLELLRQLPTVRLLACELDPFLDDSVELCRRLRECGHPDTALHVCPRTPHGAISLAALGAGSRVTEANERFTSWLSDVVWPHPPAARAATAAAAVCCSTAAALLPSPDRLSQLAAPDDL